MNIKELAIFVLASIVLVQFAFGAKTTKAPDEETTEKPNNKKVTHPGRSGGIVGDRLVVFYDKDNDVRCSGAMDGGDTVVTLASCLIICGHTELHTKIVSADVFDAYKHFLYTVKIKMREDQIKIHSEYCSSSGIQGSNAHDIGIAKLSFDKKDRHPSREDYNGLELKRFDVSTNKIVPLHVKMVSDGECKSDDDMKCAMTSKKVKTVMDRPGNLGTAMVRHTHDGPEVVGLLHAWAPCKRTKGRQCFHIVDIATNIDWINENI